MKHDSLGRVALPDVAGPPALESFPLVFLPAPLAPNASAHLLPEADTRDERTLEAVRCKPWFASPGSARTLAGVPTKRLCAPHWAWQIDRCSGRSGAEPLLLSASGLMVSVPRSHLWVLSL